MTALIDKFIIAWSLTRDHSRQHPALVVTAIIWQWSLKRPLTIPYMSVPSIHAHMRTYAEGKYDKNNLFLLPGSIFITKSGMADQCFALYWCPCPSN